MKDRPCRALNRKHPSAQAGECFCFDIAFPGRIKEGQITIRDKDEAAGKAKERIL
jgi:hypothetical protein